MDGFSICNKAVMESISWGAMLGILPTPSYVCHSSGHTGEGTLFPLMPVDAVGLLMCYQQDLVTSVTSPVLSGLSLECDKEWGVIQTLWPKCQALLTHSKADTTIMRGEGCLVNYCGSQRRNQGQRQSKPSGLVDQMVGSLPRLPSFKHRSPMLASTFQEPLSMISLHPVRLKIGPTRETSRLPGLPKMCDQHPLSPC